MRPGRRRRRLQRKAAQQHVVAGATSHGLPLSSRRQLALTASRPGTAAWWGGACGVADEPPGHAPRRKGRRGAWDAVPAASRGPSRKLRILRRMRGAHWFPLSKPEAMGCMGNHKTRASRQSGWVASEGTDSCLRVSVRTASICLRSSSCFVAGLTDLPVLKEPGW